MVLIPSNIPYSGVFFISTFTDEGQLRRVIQADLESMWQSRIQMEDLATDY